MTAIQKGGVGLDGSRGQRIFKLRSCNMHGQKYKEIYNIYLKA